MKNYSFNASLGKTIGLKRSYNAMSTKKSGGSGTTGGSVPSGATAGTNQRNKKQKVTNLYATSIYNKQNQDLELLYISTILGNILNILSDFQKAPVPPVECPVCNIQLSSHQVYVTHVEGKAHKKKLLLLEKEKTRPQEVAKGRTNKISLPVPVKMKDANTSNSSINLANNIAPLSSDTIVEIKPSCSTEECIIAPPPPKKKKKSKVVFIVLY